MALVSQVHRSLRAEFLSPELVSSNLVELQEGLKVWIESGGVGLLRARLEGMATGEKVGKLGKGSE